VKVLHTADWHLGHTLHDQNRDVEQQIFLGWLLDILDTEAADALLICGDIFDSANPPASAQALWYRFLASARTRLPRLDIIAVGGNHDSSARLDAPHPLLDEFGIRVVGGLPRTSDGEVPWERLAIPLTDHDGSVAAWVAAVPYLRPIDLPAAPDSADPLIAGVGQLYADALAAARSCCQPGQALLVTGHCYTTGGIISELSERKILGGNQHALPADIFPADVTYVALGHLHLAQRVGRDDRIRYSGAPLPLSLAETSYHHQVCLVTFAGGHLDGVREIPVPRPVELLRVPAAGALPLADLARHLRELPLNGALPFERWPYLEVAVRLDQPEPGLRRTLDEVLNGRPVRLVKITPSYAGRESDPYSVPVGTGLGDLTPEEVFCRRYRDSFEGDPPPDYLAAFHDLVQEAGQGATP